MWGPLIISHILCLIFVLFFFFFSILITSGVLTKQTTNQRSKPLIALRTAFTYIYHFKECLFLCSWDQIDFSIPLSVIHICRVAKGFAWCSSELRLFCACWLDIAVLLGFETAAKFHCGAHTSWEQGFRALWFVTASITFILT